MNFDFLTPEIFNTLIVINLIVGVILASIRFYRDMTSSTLSARSSALEDTQPHQFKK